ncbi:hypothetical protein PFISCL1PPCAC_14419, partial [Pristionchus fissidentatus]
CSYSYWLAISFLTVERAIATYFVRTYEDRFHSLRWQLLLIVGFVLFIFLSDLNLFAIPEPTLLIVCFSNTFTNLAVMYLIKHHNGRKNSIGKALSFRYQVTENLLVSAMFPLSYTIGFLHSAAMRKILVCIKFLKKK